MSRLNTALQNDLKLLKLLRDELSLQAHLMKADAKERWQQLEVKWGKLMDEISGAEDAGAEALRESETAIGLLVDSLKKGYENVRTALKR